MFHYIFKIFLFISLFTLAANSKNYNEIVIDGNIRISDESIKVFSNIPDNDELDEDKLNIILKRLYDTGFFKDISIVINNDKLIIKVKENPIIQNVNIEGIKNSGLEKSIIDILALKDRSSFNTTKFKNDEIAIVNLLKSKGYYFAIIVSSIQDLGDSKIILNYNIDIGKKAKIKKISFLGDKKIKESRLRDVIISEEYKFWKFISGKKFLNERLIDFDQKLLNNFYKNLGYFDVQINSSFANYLGNEEFELIYNISPGIKYFFNDIKLSLPMDYDENNFSKLNKIFNKLKGKNYSLNSIEKILKEIDKIVLTEQFEFLNSNVTENFDGNLINLTFNISESEKFYVEKVNIFGNNITRDDVIRNSIYVDEGDPFSDLLHTKSINNIKSLNFFRDVRSEILTGTTSNQKIINISVDEKPTGEITAGAGVGTAGTSLGFSVKENNFLGRGIRFGTDLVLSQDSIRGIIALSNPNYNGTNRSLDFKAESSVTDRLTDFGYKSNKIGFSLGSGFELYDDLYLKTGVSSYIETLKTDSKASASMKKQKGDYFDTFINYTLDYDKRDQKFKSSDGFRSTFSQNVPIISDNYSLTNTYNFKIFNKWLKENIASVGFYASTTNSLTKKDIKLSERKHLPSNKLRGFESRKIGPKDGSDYVGGNYNAAINIATTLPQVLPSLESLDFSVFFDAANVWGVDYNSNISSGSAIRSSVGIGIDYFTVIGPLNFSLTEVISKGDNDVTETFRFNLGTTF